MQDLYPMIFKRRSIRRFDPARSVEERELEAVRQRMTTLVPLVPTIKTSLRLVKAADIGCRMGEYCLLLYSEQAEHSLLNAGYLLEQMDLYLASAELGACWFGFGKPDVAQYEGLDYISMLTFGKSAPQDFRTDFSSCRRKARDVIWQGAFDEQVADTVRYAPSAANLQPWYVRSGNGKLEVFRIGKSLSLIPESKRRFYGLIDLGIFMVFLELLLTHGGYHFTRTLHPEADTESKLVKTADYLINP